MDDLRRLSLQHLRLRLRPLNRLLRRAVAEQVRRATQINRDTTSFKGLCISEVQVQESLNRSDALLAQDEDQLHRLMLDDREQQQEQVLRERVRALDAELPLDAMTRQLDLTALEMQLLLVCVAAEVDASYQDTYAYVLDDVRRRQPCRELLERLFATGLTARSHIRERLAPEGRLRRWGLLQVDGGAGLAQIYRLAERVWSGLSGQRLQWDVHFYDPAEVAMDGDLRLPPQLDAHQARRLSEDLGRGHLALLGLWGTRETSLQHLTKAVAAWAQQPLRRWPATALDAHQALAELPAALELAGSLGALLWLDLDAWETLEIAPLRPQLAELLTRHLARRHQSLIVTGHQPWRPTALLAQAPYAELNVPPPDHRARQRLWQQHLPAVNEVQIAALAARYHMNETEMQAVGRMWSVVDGRASREQEDARLQQACVTVARRGGSRLVQVRVPRRGPDDLILPPQLHRQVMDVARFYRACARVDEDWGFARLDSGGGGIKALFTGDSGTGKTLAAEVIAGRLGLTLMKVDLARIASKWIGETEKNLEAVFAEAEDSHAVLFFDEADALFARRGNVERSSDRYANLETGYLLQRLEDFRGMAVLASNLRDQIDSAFTRRFQFVIHFPRPGQDERRRLWRLAFPDTAPLDQGIDFTPFTQLDMTGAAIVSAGRTAALLAVDAGAAQIGSQHLVEAIARQYQMDARVLAPADLGPYAALMQRPA